MHHIPIWSLIPRDTEARQLAASPRPVHVLLVEDDQDAAKMTRIALEDSTDQFRVEWVPDLTSAMHRLARRGIDAIVLDLGLPESTGYLSYHAIEAAMDRQIPVVILTSDDRSHIRELTMATGAYNYLMKGQATPGQLRKILREAVSNRIGGDLDSSSEVTADLPD